jgi:glycosyltransferase involved in cell wall biosynthesis
MKEPPKIAILLPVFNGGELLKLSIESVLSQTMSSFELIISDDGSSDGSREYLASLHDARIILSKKEGKRGLFPNLNRLLALSSAPLIHLWSQDDIMCADCLEETLAFHASHPEVGMSWCQFQLINANGNIYEAPWNMIRCEWLLTYELYAELSLIWGCLPYNIANVTLTRKAVEQAGLFREDLTYAGDFEYWSRIAKVAPIARIGERLIQLRSHSAQLSANLSARVKNVEENLTINLELINGVRLEFRAEILRCYWWKTVPNAAVAWWLCIRDREWGLARECWQRLRPFGMPGVVVLMALLMHLLKIMQLDTVLHRKLFLNAHYSYLKSIKFPDEGIASLKSS